MFNAETTYAAMECRSSSPKDCGAVSGTYLLKDEDVEEDSTEDSDSLKEEPTQTPSPGKSRKCILAISLAAVFVVGVAIAILVLVVTALTTSPQGGLSPVAQGQSVLPMALPTTVTPRCGDVANGVVCLGEVESSCRLMLIGSQEEDIFVFKGVPYALPPISERRWKQPVPFSASCPDAEPTQRVYAQSFANKCIQLGRDDVRSEGSEDCLYLNVWTPTLESNADLHVMVYFHGGGLIAGSGNENDSLPTPELVTAANMVFVTFNYRLNAFGFLALEALATGGASGNYGLMDQILVLQWIQTNIQSFGGNPNKVTVFGQGSGATSIYALLASKRAAGLFQKAWLASPSPKLESSLAEAYVQNAEFLNNTECADGRFHLDADRLGCLLNLSAEKVLQAVPWKLWKNAHFYRLPLKTERSAIIAIIDGFVLKLSPLGAWKKKTFNAVPLLIGNTAQETDIFPMNERLVAWSLYDNYVYQLMLPFDHVTSSEVLSMYGHSLTPEHSLASMVSDMRVICPVDEMVKVAANASRLPVYRYIASIFTDKKFSASGIQKNYAYSGIDVDAFFSADSDTHKDEHFTALMRDIVFGFVRNGSVSNWDVFPHSAYNVSTSVERMKPRFESPECNFWRTNWFFPSYAWMN